MNECRYSYTFLFAYMTWCLVKDRGNNIFYLPWDPKFYPTQILEIALLNTQNKKDNFLYS
jgi:hypothetical protein